MSLNRERGELESGATAALRQGAFVGIGLFRRLGQVDEQERGERGLFCAHWATCRACPTLALDSPGKFRWTPPVLRLSYFNNLKRANRSDHNNSVNQTDITNTRTPEQERQWDGQPYQKMAWYMLNSRALLQEIPEARQFIESGVLVGSKTVTVYSLAHAQAYINGDYARGTLKAPFDFSTLPAQCTPISTPVAAAVSSDDEEGAIPSTPPSTERIPTTLADLGADTRISLKDVARKLLWNEQANDGREAHLRAPEHL